jgi:hypothetical protein
MIQLVISLAVVSGAAGIAVYRIIRYFIDPPDKCEGCVKNCGDCPVDELKRRVEAKNRTAAG